MRLLLRIVVALYAGFLLSSLFQFMWGEAGIHRMRNIEEHRDRLIANIEDLERIHSDLILERDALLYDETEIELRAREFGFYREDEIPIKLPGGRMHASSRMLGTLVREIPTARERSQMFRLLFLSASIAVFAATFLWRRHGTNHPG